MSEQDVAAMFWRFAFVDAWRAIGEQYSRDAVSARFERRRANPYVGAREAIWLANHGGAS